MSRRNSRSNPVEYDPLVEFENFKRKFLLINKHITKMNSGLNTKVEELNSQLSCLYVENLRLRTLNVSLGVQLKQEREKSQKLMAEMETCAAHFMKQMTTLRQTHSMPYVSPHSVQQDQQPKARRPTTPPPRRISRSPSIHRIHEVNSSEEEDRIAALSGGRPHSSLSVHSRLPRPVLETLAESPDPWHKKTSRRKSGYLEGLQRPPSPSPGSPITAEIKALSARMTDDGEDLEMEVEDINGVQDNLSEMPLLRTVSPDGVPKKTKRSSTPIVEEMKEAIVTKANVKQTKKATGLRRVGLLKDMTNSNNYDNGTHASAVFSVYPKSSEGPPTEIILTHVDTPALPSQSLPPMHSTAGSMSAALSTHSMDELGDNYSSTTGRERRSRKSVNYAEPSLKVKMRKPDGVPSSKPKRKKSSLSRNVESEGTDGDAGADGDAENDAPRLNGTSVRRRSAAVASALEPIAETRRHSIAA